jgi:hypothetical protein
VSCTNIALKSITAKHNTLVLISPKARALTRDSDSIFQRLRFIGCGLRSRDIACGLKSDGCSAECLYRS